MQGAIEGDWEHPSSTASHQQSHQQPQTAPTHRPQHRPIDLSKSRREIHLVKINYCEEDTRPQNQLNAAKEQHKDLCNILQGASVTLHIIHLAMGVGGTIYTHTLTPF